MAPTIVTRSQWGARAPRSSIPRTTWSQRTGVAVHHSAGPTTQTVRQIQNFQMDSNGWSDIGYNWLVTQDGRIWEGRAGGWLAIGAHAGGQNTGWIGVCWLGTSGNTAPSAAALTAIRWLVDEARRLSGRRLDVRGHGQVPGQATECPGSRLRAWIAAGLPTDDEEDDMQLDDKVSIPQWMVDRWPDPGLKDGSITVNTALGSGYGHSRSGKDEVYRQTPLIKAILAAVAGDDVAEAAATAAREGVRAEFATLGPALAAQLADVPAERVEAALRAVLGSLDEG